MRGKEKRPKGRNKDRENETRGKKNECGGECCGCDWLSGEGELEWCLERRMGTEWGNCLSLFHHPSVPAHHCLQILGSQPFQEVQDLNNYDSDDELVFKLKFVQTKNIQTRNVAHSVVFVLWTWMMSWRLLRRGSILVTRFFKNHNKCNRKCLTAHKHKISGKTLLEGGVTVNVFMPIWLWPNI